MQQTHSAPRAYNVPCALRSDEGGANRGRDRLQLLLKDQPEVDLEEVKKYDDADDADSGDDLDSSDADDDSDDDEEALEKELEKIRREREEAKKKKVDSRLYKVDLRMTDAPTCCCTRQRPSGCVDRRQENPYHIKGERVPTFGTRASVPPAPGRARIKENPCTRMLLNSPFAGHIIPNTRVGDSVYACITAEWSANACFVSI